MLAGLKAHRFDASWSAWTVTRERTEVLNLVTYLQGGTSALVKAGDPKGIKKPLDLCGRTVAAQTGTAQAQGNMDDLQRQCAAAGRPAIKPMVVPQQTNVNQAVATGRADAMLAARHRCRQHRPRGSRPRTSLSRTGQAETGSG
ncbi:hypothetical protein [Spirillospora sp. CA-128828]|uniref:hypothetical protein n=1 Tax=Spirillospora sp. CA-128828 TaxID=3240033 RepID=UPI003D8AD921